MDCNCTGSVSKLDNLIERLMNNSYVESINSSDLPEHLWQATNKNRQKVKLLDLCTIKDATEQLEKQLLKKAYDKYRNTYRMAEVLGINQSTVVRKMKKYRINGEK